MESIAAVPQGQILPSHSCICWDSHVTNLKYHHATSLRHTSIWFEHGHVFVCGVLHLSARLPCIPIGGGSPSQRSALVLIIRLGSCLRGRMLKFKATSHPTASEGFMSLGNCTQNYRDTNTHMHKICC